MVNDCCVAGRMRTNATDVDADTGTSYGSLLVRAFEEIIAKLDATINSFIW